jgi:hypothetical protein
MGSQEQAAMNSLADMEQASVPPVIEARRKGVNPDDIFLDAEQVFLVYATLLGDAEATAAAVGCSAAVVAKLADTEKWDDRIAPMVKKKKSQRPGDVERAINRAINFAQAHRLRMFLERVARQLYDMEDNALQEYLVKVTPGAKPDSDGKQKMSLSTRPLADLATAIEKAQVMTYQALSDTATDRKTRDEGHDDGEMSAAALHAQIAKAMNDAAKPQTGAGQLAAAQIGMAQINAKETVHVSVGAAHLLK